MAENNTEKSKGGMSATNWIAFGGLVVAALTCYFTFFGKKIEPDLRQPDINVVVKPEMKQEVIIHQPQNQPNRNSITQNKNEYSAPLKKTKEDKPVETSTNNIGLSIKIIDASSRKPVEGVSISLSGFTDVLTSNKNGDFIIPKNIIAERGEYNSIRAYFTRNGFEPTDFEIGLSEPQTFKINKSQ